MQVRVGTCWEHPWGCKNRGEGKAAEPDMDGGAVLAPGAHRLAPARCNILLQAHLSWFNLFPPALPGNIWLPPTYLSNSLT